MHEIRDKLRHERAHLHEKSKRGFLHFLFGRSTLILLLLAAQVFLLIGLFARWQFSAYAYGLSYVLSAFMAVYLLNRPMNATSRQTWLILILLLPVLGSTLCISLIYFFEVPLTIGRRLKVMTAIHGGAVVVAAAVSLLAIPAQGLQGVLLALYASAGCDVLAMAAVTARMCRKAETPA